QGSGERWTAGLGIGAFARAAAVRAAAAPTSEASNKRSCPCVRIWRESLPLPTKLSEFKQAAAHVETLRRLRRLRQAYGCESSPPQRAIIELDVEHRPEPVV